MATRGGWGAPDCSGSGGDCNDAMLRVGDPRTSDLPGGVDGLPAASPVVSSRLGIDGALPLRHLCLWIFLISERLLHSFGSVPAPASVDSCCTPGSSPAISAPWLVVVKMQSSLPRGGHRLRDLHRRSALALPVDADRRLRRFRAGLHAFGESVIRRCLSALRRH
jgi:hypothetical protein